MLKRVIASVCIGEHITLQEMAISRLNLYAKIHGYDVSICKDSLDLNRPPAWSKLLHIRNLMHVYDEIFWIDADALILDLSRDIKEVVERETDLAWVYHEYDNQRHPNSGVMYMKTNSKTQNLIVTAIEQRDLDLHPWWDQAALMRVLGKDSVVWPIGPGLLVNHLEIHEQALPVTWNSIRLNAVENPRIRHFAGEVFWVRKLLMAEYTLPQVNSLMNINDVISEVNIVGQEHLSCKQEILSLTQEILSLTKDYEIVVNSRSWKFLTIWRFLRNLRLKSD
jgi:hypothetical protein